MDGSRVVIDDFISPSILERLGQQEGVLAPQITGWRSMVDSVMIDTAHDGEVFNVVVIDVPERKTDVVTGTYEVELPAGSSAPVAVKITDMLGRRGPGSSAAAIGGWASQHGAREARRAFPPPTHGRGSRRDFWGRAPVSGCPSRSTRPC